MTLTINKRFIKAGTVIDVTWNCDADTNPQLVMHTGSRESILTIPNTGSKRFRMKTPGVHWIGIKTFQGGKMNLTRRRFVVYGKQPSNTDNFEYMDKRSNWWNRIKDYYRRVWNMYTPEKRRLYLVMLLLLAYQFIVGLWPDVGRVFFYCIIFWLFWQVMRK